MPTLKQNMLQEEFISVIEKREKRRVLGKPFKWYPHITNEIKDRMQLFNSGDYDIVITEIKETVGHRIAYIESVRQMVI
jgi:CTP synthase (UTP-ammonia lyase)